MTDVSLRGLHELCPLTCHSLVVPTRARHKASAVNGGFHNVRVVVGWHASLVGLCMYELVRSLCICFFVCVSTRVRSRIENSRQLAIVVFFD